MCRAGARGSSRSPPAANNPSSFGWDKDSCSRPPLWQVLPAPAHHPTTVCAGQRGRGASNAETTRAAALSCRAISESPTQASPKPTEFGTNSWRNRRRAFLPPCTRGSLSGRRSPGLAGEQKPFTPPPHQVTFLPSYVMALGRFGLWHVVIKQTSHPEPGVTGGP